MSATIGEQSDQLKAAAAVQLPSDVALVFARRADEMARRGTPATAVKVGDQLATFTLLDALDRPVTLEDLTTDGPAVIVFYRGGWCPYCNLALRTYQQDLVPHLAEFCAKLVAISPQRPDDSMTTAMKSALEYPVLSDPGCRIARRIGIAFDETEEVMAAQRSLGLDLAAANAEAATALPMPTALVVDTDRVVRFVDVHPDYTTRTEVADIVGALAALPGD